MTRSLRDDNLWECRGDCPRDECDGLRWEHDSTAETACAECYTLLSDSSSSEPRRARERRASRQRYSSEKYEEYSKSGHVRLAGGYERAYYSWRTGEEYAIDVVDDREEGLLAPHSRNWERAAGD